MDKIANKQVICDVLMREAEKIKILWHCAVIPGEVLLFQNLQILIRNSL